MQLGAEDLQMSVRRVKPVGMGVPCIANDDLHVQETAEKSSLCPAAGAWELDIRPSLGIGRNAKVDE